MSHLGSPVRTCPTLAPYGSHDVQLGCIHVGPSRVAPVGTHLKGKWNPYGSQIGLPDETHVGSSMVAARWDPSGNSLKPIWVPNGLPAVPSSPTYSPYGSHLGWSAGDYLHHLLSLTATHDKGEVRCPVPFSLSGVSHGMQIICGSVHLRSCKVNSGYGTNFGVALLIKQNGLSSAY